MEQYLDLCNKALNGTLKANRTGVDTIGYIDDMCKYNLADGFPAVTTKKLAFKSVVAEMLGFLRGYDRSSQFEELGCNVWKANACSEYWMSTIGNCLKDGDYLGRIYGVQGRDWQGLGSDRSWSIDQLRGVVDDLSKGIDNRREIITYWNPAELDEMALPPCHLLHKFSLDGDGKLHLCMFQRSCDVPLGVPFNIAGYAWLLSVIAHITGHEVGTFTHFMSDIHIYLNQVEQMEEQVKREPLPLPTLWINPKIKTLEDLETWVTPDDFKLLNYTHHDNIKYEFTV